EHPTEADLITVAHSLGFCPNGDPVHGRAVLAPEIGEICGTAVKEDLCVLAGQARDDFGAVRVEWRFRSSDGEHFVLDAYGPVFRMGYRLEHDLDSPMDCRRRIRERHCATRHVCLPVFSLDVDAGPAATQRLVKSDCVRQDL